MPIIIAVCILGWLIAIKLKLLDRACNYYLNNQMNLESVVGGSRRSIGGKNLYSMYQKNKDDGHGSSANNSTMDPLNPSLV